MWIYNNINKSKEDFIQDYSNLFNQPVDKLHDDIYNARALYNNKSSTSGLIALSEIWYNSLTTSNPDYSVYGHNDYFPELWCCWFTYSRNYLKRIFKTTLKDDQTTLVDYLNNPKQILDVGCGLGFTTRALSEFFSNATVTGTNLPDTDQFKFCQHWGKKYNFNMSGSFIKSDVVFAFEYFEHIERPLEHLEELVSVSEPKFIFTANSFGTTAIGHFIEYKDDNRAIPMKQMTKEFRKKMQELGYRKVPIKTFNDTPILWEKVPEEPVEPDTNLTEWYNA